MPLLLSQTALSSLPEFVAVPRYDLQDVPIGIVHLGIGAFHRAHQATYTDDAIAAAGGAWGICGVSLRSPGIRDRLVPQDCLYTVVEKAAAGTTYRIVGSVREVLFRGDGLESIVARIAAPGTRIVSLTITEKGYCHDPSSGVLNAVHPDIAHDLIAPEDPISAIGLLALALDRRRAQGAGPLTVLCCDNLPHNGRLVENMMKAYARERGAGLAAWIAANVSFPSTMVDRIVPATTESDLAEVDRALGLLDAAPVVCEPFRQWVIAGEFVAGRPAWERAGAQFVADVAPFEAMKLRLLNGSHSLLAYLGYLAGYETIWQVAAQPDFAAVMRALMEEATPTLRLPADVDLAAYKAALVERFGNPALPHRTQQIAMDGSQKLPQRLLDTVRANLAAGRPIDCAALAVAGWMRYVSGLDEAGRPISVSDPLAADLARIASAHRGDPAALARGLFGLAAVFGTDLPNDPRFTGAVTRWLESLFALGAARTVARAAQRQAPPLAAEKSP
jgi:fructuronate reductase